MKKPVRDNTPNPHTYKTAESIAKTQLKKPVRITINREKSTSYLDQVKERSKKIPGIGKYKIEDSYKFVSIGPPSLKMKRH